MIRPESWEYPDFFADYVANVPDGSVIEMLGAEVGEWRNLLAEVSEGEAERQPREGQWTIKEVLGHLCDAERIFGYRALHIARGDQIDLPSFEQDDYVRESRSNSRKLADLLNEFTHLRCANVAMFGSMTALDLQRTGTVDGGLMSVRALAFIIAGHEMRHLKLMRAKLEAKPRIEAAERTTRN
jgi:hypothetical protein